MPAPRTGRPGRLRGWLLTAVERLALGAGAAASTTLVLAWAGVRWRTAVVAGAAAALLVLVAAVVAATVPAPPERTPEITRDDHHTE